MLLDSFVPYYFTFYFMARLADIMPKSAKSFDPHCHLTHGDVAVTSYGLLVTFLCLELTIRRYVLFMLIYIRFV